MTNGLHSKRFFFLNFVISEIKVVVYLKRKRKIVTLMPVINEKPSSWADKLAVDSVILG